MQQMEAPLSNTVSTLPNISVSNVIVNSSTFPWSRSTVSNDAVANICSLDLAHCCSNCMETHDCCCFLLFPGKFCESSGR